MLKALLKALTINIKRIFFRDKIIENNFIFDFRKASFFMIIFGDFDRFVKHKYLS